MPFLQVWNEIEAKNKVIRLSTATPKERREGKRLNLPCGKCAICQLRYANEWANRCSLEASNYQNNEFITLTYNNENLPTNRISED